MSNNKTKINYFMDLEFHEFKKKPLLGKAIDTIDLISIGIVSQDGREYYAISKDFDLRATWNNEWLRENVLPSIYIDLLHKGGINGFQKNNWNFTYKHLKRLIKLYGVSNTVIASEIIQFVCDPNNEAYSEWLGGMDEYLDALIKYHNIEPTFFCYFGSYDWVAFCWLFGRMIDLPNGFPMYQVDLKQIMDELGLDKKWKEIKCPDPIGEHNAVVDARWNRELYEQLMKVKRSVL